MPRGRNRAPVIQRPSPVAEAREEFEAQAVARAARIEHQVTERNRYAELSEAIKAKLDQAAGPTAGDFIKGMSKGETFVRDEDAAFAALTHELADAMDAEALKRQLRDQDEESYVWLWDKPINGMHHGKSKFHVNQIRDALKIGFSDVKLCPEAPGPTLHCDYVNPMGVPCDKLLYLEEDIEPHQRTKHVEWFRQREARRQRERDERQIEQTELLTQAMSAIVAGQGGGDPTELAALREQVEQLRHEVQSREPAGTGTAA